MKTLLTAATMAAALIAAPPPVAANIFADASLLATIESVKVFVVDDVKGGCLFNAEKIKARLSATLERSGITVSEGSRWLFFVYLVGNAVRSGDSSSGCVANFNFQLLHHEPNDAWILAAQAGALSLGPDVRDSYAMQNAEQFADEMIASILAARRSVSRSDVSGPRS
jgi:hypothetical protein